MIPLSTFNLLIGIDFLLILYSVIDHRNRLYANIVTSTLAIILSKYIGSAASVDAVQQVLGDDTTIMNSLSFGFFMDLIATVMFFYTVFMIYEMISEYIGEKKAREEEKEDEDL